MRTFEEYQKLYESNDANAQLDAKMQEILDDIDNLSTSMKKNAPVAAKYDIEASKVADLRKALWQKMLDCHKSKTGGWNILDDKAYSECTGSPSLKSKLVEVLKQEPRDYVESILLPRYIKTAGTAWKVQSTASASMREKMYFKMAKIVKEFLDSTSKEGLSKVENDKILYEKLDEMLAEFHTTYVEDIVDTASGNYDLNYKEYGKLDWPTIIKGSMSKFLELMAAEFKEEIDAEQANRAEIERLKEDGYNKNIREISRLGTNSPANKLRAKLTKMYNKFNGWNKPDFMREVREEAEAEYRRCLELVVDRINKTDMDKSSISVTSIDSNDAKAFDIVVTDGLKTFYARSIFAAAASTIVTPHWRFIITDKTPKSL